MVKDVDKYSALKDVPKLMVKQEKHLIEITKRPCITILEYFNLYQEL